MGVPDLAARPNGCPRSRAQMGVPDPAQMGVPDPAPDPAPDPVCPSSRPIGLGPPASRCSGVACEVNERGNLECLCRDITHPAVSTARLSLTAQGNIRYCLVAPAHPAHATFVHPCTAKTPWRDGTTDVVFHPLDFMARLVALVPTLRVNLTRYHRVFAPNHRLREQVTPARRGRRKSEITKKPAPVHHPNQNYRA